MNNIFLIKKEYYAWIIRLAQRLTPQQWVLVLSVVAAVIATIYSYTHGTIASYGDAESHLNIAKRVIDSLTPGFAQLGGIWLPLPHIFLIPFVSIDFLWRTGLAGSIVSGIAFVVSALFIYKLTYLITNFRVASFLAALIFIINPNILYLQSTPMTEVILIMFFLLSGYFFIKYLLSDGSVFMLILAAFFGLLASLSRYDGWALVLMEAGILFLYHLLYRLDPKWFYVIKNKNASFVKIWKTQFKKIWSRLEGRMIIFVTPAFFGIALWLLWGFLILGDPLYFTHSQFSANSQQQSWLSRGELPAYHNMPVALLYYFMTSIQSGGVLISFVALVGLIAFGIQKENRYRIYILLLLLVPFFFNVLTLFIGQSVIFLPGVTPTTFEWTLFNVRYGSMMVPVFAVFSGYLFYRSKIFGKVLIGGLVVVQCGLFLVGFSPILSYDDGVRGLSSAVAKVPDAQNWLAKEYDGGLLLTDDFARTISIIRTSIPMENVIYIGNKPYWEESLIEPQKYASWIVMQKDDTVWKNVYDRPEVNARLFKYFQKVYTSDEILIFRRIEDETL